MKLFGSSGVRGLINTELTPVLAERVGLAIATSSKAKEALVARDTRLSGPMLESALISGLESGGTPVKHMGILPTPVLAFLTKKTRAGVGVMITASHNPPEYNGIKVFACDGSAYDEESQNEIERIIIQERFRLAEWRSVGRAQALDGDHLYIEELKERIKLKKKWHVAVDPGCGATFKIAPTVLQGLGCRVTALNAQPDGWFPARSPEPDAKSLTYLARVVKILGAEGGLAYDGDGDRAAFVDGKGVFAGFDKALAAYAAHVVKKNGGGTVVTNVDASMAVEKMVEPQGGRVIRTRVGDVYISNAMKKHHALFGGEPCGAWIHPQFHQCPDGVLSSALVLEASEYEKESLTRFVGKAPTYPILRENFGCKNDVKENAVEQIGEGLKSAFPEYCEFSAVDGVRLALEEGWLLVRASGTEPAIRLTVEGESLKAARKIMRKGAESVKKVLGRGKR